MYHPEVVGKPRTRQRQLLFSTFGAFGTSHLNSRLVSVQLSEHPPPSHRLSCHLALSLLYLVPSRWISEQWPSPAGLLSIPSRGCARAGTTHAPARVSIQHPESAQPSLPKNAHTPGAAWRDPCGPPLPCYMVGGVAITLLTPAHGLAMSSPKWIRPSCQITSGLSLPRTSPKRRWGNREEILLLTLPPAGIPASPCASTELPPLLQTTCKNQGKQEPMLQLMLQLSPLWLYWSL